MWPLSAIGLGLLVISATSGNAAAETSELANCKDTLQACRDMIGSMRQQRDAAESARMQCEAERLAVVRELDLFKGLRKPGGLTHRQALALMELSMKTLEKPPDAEASPAELLYATRKLRLYQEKATSLSKKLTDQATKASEAVASP